MDKMPFMLLILAGSAMVATLVGAVENEPVPVQLTEEEDEKGVEEIYDLLRSLPKYKTEILKEAIQGESEGMDVDKRSCKGWLGKCRRQDHLCCNNRCRCGFKNQYCCL